MLFPFNEYLGPWPLPRFRYLSPGRYSGLCLRRARTPFSPEPWKGTEAAPSPALRTQAPRSRQGLPSPPLPARPTCPGLPGRRPPPGGAPGLGLPGPALLHGPERWLPPPATSGEAPPGTGGGAGRCAGAAGAQVPGGRSGPPDPPALPGVSRDLQSAGGGAVQGTGGRAGLGAHAPHVRGRPDTPRSPCATLYWEGTAPPAASGCRRRHPRAQARAPRLSFPPRSLPGAMTRVR